MATMNREELQIKEAGIGGGWNHPKFDDARKEFDTIFIISRKDRIAERILECKCGSRKIISTQVQSRSRDEGMSIFAKCSICGKRWKERVYLQTFLILGSE